MSTESLQKHTRQHTVEQLRRRLPKGTRLVLQEMDDPRAPPVGTKGTVEGIDDAGHILMHWDNGSGLNLIPGHDRYSILHPGDEV